MAALMKLASEAANTALSPRRAMSLRRDPAETAKEDRYGGEIGEATEREGDDPLGEFGELTSGIEEGFVGDELVQDDLLSDETATLGGLRPRHSEQPGERREYVSEDFLESDFGVPEPGTDGANSQVQKRDQGDEGEEHGADVERELEPDRSTLRCRIQDIDGLVVVLGLRKVFLRGVGFRHEDLGKE